MNREALIQKAIEEWASIAAGPDYRRPHEPSLAHYIEAVVAENEKPLRADALNVLTVYDDNTPVERRGPWRDRLMQWAQDEDAAEPGSDECVSRLGAALSDIQTPTHAFPYWVVILAYDDGKRSEHRGFTMKDALNEALATHEGFDRHAETDEDHRAATP